MIYGTVASIYSDCSTGISDIYLSLQGRKFKANDYSSFSQSHGTFVSSHVSMNSWLPKRVASSPSILFNIFLKMVDDMKSCLRVRFEKIKNLLFFHHSSHLSKMTYSTNYLVSWLLFPRSGKFLEFFLF